MNTASLSRLKLWLTKPRLAYPASEGNPLTVSASGIAPLLASFTLKEPRRLPIIDKYSASLQTKVAIGAAVIFLLIAGALGSYGLVQNRYLQTLVEATTELQALSQRISKEIQRAVTGESQSFAEVTAIRNQIDQDVSKVMDGAGRQSIAEGPAAFYAEDLAKNWETMKPTLDTFAKNSADMIRLRNSVSQIDADSQKAAQGLESMYVLAVQLGYSDSTIYRLSAAIRAMSTLTLNLKSAATDPFVVIGVAQQIEADRKTVKSSFEAVRLAHESGGISPGFQNEVTGRLTETSEDFAVFDKLANETESKLKNLLEGKSAGLSASGQTENLFISALAVKTIYLAEERTLAYYFWSAGLFGMLGLLAAFATLAVNSRENGWQAYLSAKQADDGAKEMKLNTDGINILYEMLEKVAAGDLTQKARTTEALTGAVAHVLNKTVRRIGKTIGSVKTTMFQISQTSVRANEVSAELSLLMGDQAQQVQQATIAVEQIAESADKTEQSATRTSEFAREALATVKRGIESVQATVASTQLVSENMQRQAKLVKRLGERSQEVAEIASILSRLAQLAKVLALNASIESERAGPEGRRFRVVAEEIQQLANNVNESLLQVSNITKMTQTDAREALQATDAAVDSVVKASRTAQESGDALTKIGEVTQALELQVASILDLVGKQRLNTQEAKDLMLQVLGYTHQSVATVTEVAKSNAAMVAEAETLEADLSTFQVAGIR